MIRRLTATFRPSLAPRLTLPLLLALGLAGCVTDRPPRVAVSQAVLTETEEDLAAIDVLLNLSNPNPDALRLVEFNYTFRVEGGGTYRGRHAGEATVAAGQARQARIPAVVRVDLAAVTPGEALRYTIEGHLRYISEERIARTLYDAKLRRPRAGFRGSGSVVDGRPFGGETVPENE